MSFRYRPGLPDAIHDVSFEVAPGETVALVGHSGAGKSTCAHLLLRLWDVVDGAITVGGHDLRDFPQEALRQLVTVVELLARPGAYARLLASQITNPA